MYYSKNPLKDLLSGPDGKKLYKWMYPSKVTTKAKYKKKYPKPYKKIAKFNVYDKTASNSKKLKLLKEKIDNNEATKIYRTRFYTVVEPGNFNNRCVYRAISGLDKTILDASITVLKYFDPAVPATLQTVDYNEGSFNKQILIKTKASLRVRNNYRVAANLEVYICKVKSDTDQSPFAAISNGFADVGGNDVFDPLTKALDSKILKDLWTVKLLKKCVIQPSQAFSFYHYGKQFSYDTSLVDTHNLEFVKQFDSYSWLIRLEGDLAHDSVLIQQGHVKAAVDVESQTDITIKYDAGVDLFFVETAVNQTSFTNNAVMTLIDTEQAGYTI